MAKATVTKSESATAANGVQIVKKISNDLFKSAPIGEKIAVAGTVRSMETKTSDKGEYTKFTGDFACKVGNQVSKSFTAYFPEIAASLLKDGFMKASEAAEVGAQCSVEFSFFVVKVASEKSKTGYIWAIETKVAPTPETDRTLALLG